MDDDSIDASLSRPLRGRPRRPTAQRSVHQLVLNLTHNQSDKRTNSLTKKRQNSSQLTDLTPNKTPIAETPPEVTSKWVLGQRVEARDVVGDWYSAKVVAFSEDKQQVLVHFERWSSRYDQWFALDSEFIRERRLDDEQNDNNSNKAFQVGEEVLARWTDGRPYPASVVQRFDSQKSVLVLFFDGYRKKVKTNQIEKMPKDFDGLRVPQPLQKEFQVKDDHNDFKCLQKDCNKSFRKQSLLAQHLKHYHKRDQKSEQKETQEPLKPFVAIEPTVVTPEPPPPPPPAKSETPKPDVTTRSRVKRRYARRSQSSVRKSIRTETEVSVVVPNVANLVPSLVNERLTPNTCLPFWDARTIAEIHENDDIEEVVHCVCSAREESGLMVQCELCLCWQHAHCMHFEGERDVPKTGYFCAACRFPRGVRKSRRSAFLVNHSVKQNRKPIFKKFIQNDDKTEDRIAMSATHALLAATLDVRQVLRSRGTIGSNDSNSQKEIKSLLDAIEAKVTKLETQEAEEEAFEVSLKDDSDVKTALFMAFRDLKSAKKMTKFVF
ncbi:uncharacterized protein LOC128965712 [Oppia nitens]|uniref:uncharacterized protein LOC128965712 n=1 Tax=Oppia nitens TaxID=1686743 RepID=UPI0023DB6AE9|nr:uncharacterized protein LOC128965712 [Oppia nitens]